MANSIRDAIDEQILFAGKKVEELTLVKQGVPAGLLDLEGDSVSLWSARWFRFVDESHPELCVKLMELGFSPDSSGRKQMTKKGMKAGFYLMQNDDHVFVDVIRPPGGCRKARVLVAEERVIELCGDLPDNYELIEVLDD